MPDVNYVITIKREGYSAVSSDNYIANPPSGESSFGTVNPNNATDNVTNSFSKFTKISAVIAPVKFALKMLDVQATTHINRIELRTGNALLQERISYQYSAAKTALLGAIPWAIKQYGEVRTQENINIENAVQSIGLAQARIRAGAIGRRY